MAINANYSGYVVAPSPASRKKSASLTFSWLPDPFRLEFGGSIMKAPLARSRWSGLTNPEAPHGERRRYSPVNRGQRGVLEL